jgi:drug/metabolite transporter (DMT)-like permease
VTDTAFHSRVQMRTALLILLIVVLNAAGNVFLSIGMRRAGEIQPWSWSWSRLEATARLAAASGSVWMGVALLALFLVTFLLVLSWADYSYVQPASAAGYALVPLLAYAIAGEEVSALRWSGVALIAVGVLLVGRTPVRTSGQG